MSVHYKFKSSLDYDTISFDGLHISVADLKKEIIQKKKIGKTQDFDLQITNAQTKEGKWLSHFLSFFRFLVTRTLWHQIWFLFLLISFRICWRFVSDSEEYIAGDCSCAVGNAAGEKGMGSNGWKGRRIGIRTGT